ncbi:major outer membrane protein [Campylobacter concisus]|uniref:major outer membrane protein n=1 Tax=Campylobacter concisus TaxID=199 RepID=UPI0011E68EB0|nr:major outer membrane protein [Campylobacter concisus]
MKLTKVSLAALVALGAFSSVASATPLEEAIKNVDLSGYARYRYTNDHFKDSAASDTKKSSIAAHTFRMQTAFKAAIDDNFFGVLNLRYQANDGSGDNNGVKFGTRYNFSGNGTDKTNTTDSFGVYEMYLGYKIGNTTVTAGKQLLGTFYDAKDLAGTGIKVVNTDVPGLTLAAAAFDAIESESMDTSGPLVSTLVDGSLFSDSSANIYYLAALGNYDPLSFKIAIANVSEVAALYGADAGLNFNINEDVSINGKAQYVHNESDNKNVADANFWAVQAGLKAYGAKFNAGYLDFDAKNKETDAKNKDKASFVTLDGNGDLINPAKILNGGMSSSAQFYNHIKGNNDYWFVNGGYSIDKFGFGAGYTKGKGHSWALGKDRAKRDEWYLDASYKYSKKLTFLSWYAFAKDKKDGAKFEQDRIRFEAKYSF